MYLFCLFFIQSNKKKAPIKIAIRDAINTFTLILLQ